MIGLERVKFSDSRDFICGFCQERYDCSTCNVTKLEKAVDETQRYVATDIDWDCEEYEREDIPKRLVIPTKIDISDEDAVSDFLTDYTGYFHFGYNLCPLPEETIADGERMNYINDNLMVSFVNIGEGYFGLYESENPLDENLLRIEAYTKKNKGDVWQFLEDSSVCLAIPSRTPVGVLENILKMIWKEFEEVMQEGCEMPVKRKTEEISRIYWTELEC